MPPGRLDVDALAERLAPASVGDIRPLSGGASSLTFEGLMDGRRRVVVKVAPPGIPPVLNRDVLRQARLMKVLEPTAVPVPEVLWQDPGDPPEVPPLFVMGLVDGVSIEPLFDRDGDEDEAVVAERVRQASAALAHLHAVNPGAPALCQEPRVTLLDEVDRWCRSLSTVDTTLAPGWPALAEELRASQPAPLGPSVLHGDFRLGNMLAGAAGINAVVDWEIWSVGDPRVDLGWFVLNLDPGTYSRSTRYSRALPSPSEVTELYSRSAGRVLPDMAWFRAFACFKSAATWSLIVKHNRRRESPDPDLEAMAGSVPDLLGQGRRFLAERQ